MHTNVVLLATENCAERYVEGVLKFAAQREELLCENF
jgi:hypothetical protein